MRIFENPIITPDEAGSVAFDAQLTMSKMVKWHIIWAQVGTYVVPVGMKLIDSQLHSMQTLVHGTLSMNPS